MPVQYDLPEYTLANQIEDVDKYNKMPFWLALQESKLFPQWQIFNQLYGKLSWKPNMGTQLKTVQAEPTPLGQQTFFPNELTSLPNKNLVETFEVTETATLKWHDFDSKIFHFLPSFQDFRENQVDFVHTDLIRNIALSNDIFLRTFMLQKARNIYVVGSKAADGALTPAPYVAGDTLSQAVVDAQGKNAAFWAAQIQNIGVAGLTLAAVDHAVNVFRDDIAAPFFEGTVNTPKDNELIKGKYLLVGSSEAYQQFKWDKDMAAMKSINLNIVNDGFRGSLFDEVTYKTERYPIRLKADGSMPVPELMDANTKRTRPNPDYVKAPYEVAWLLGDEAIKAIKVGPPPRAFASAKMSSEKFYQMRWNGEVYLHDQVLVTYADNSIQLNHRGRFLQLSGCAVLGAVVRNGFNMMPILFQRKRVAVA
jgi:hypothetical protein